MNMKICKMCNMTSWTDINAFPRHTRGWGVCDDNTWEKDKQVFCSEQKVMISIDKIPSKCKYALEQTVIDEHA